MPLAQLGTKPDLVTAPAQGAAAAPSWIPLFQTLIAVGIVFALLKLVAPKLIAKFGRRIHTPFGSPIQLLESASCGAANLQVVEVRGQTLLLAVTQSGVNCLANLTESKPQATPVPAFFDFIDQAKSQPEEALVAKAVVTQLPPGADSEDTDPEPVSVAGVTCDDPLAAYERLARLTHTHPISEDNR